MTFPNGVITELKISDIKIRPIVKLNNTAYQFSIQNEKGVSIPARWGGLNMTKREKCCVRGTF